MRGELDNDIDDDEVDIEDDDKVDDGAVVRAPQFACVWAHSFSGSLATRGLLASGL